MTPPESLALSGRQCPTQRVGLQANVGTKIANSCGLSGLNSVVPLLRSARRGLTRFRVHNKLQADLELWLAVGTFGGSVGMFSRGR